MSIDSKYQRQVRCHVCSSEESKILYHYPKQTYNHDSYITHSWDGGKNVDLTIVKCSKCGFVYQNPIFKDEYLGLLYPESIIPEKLTNNHINLRRFDGIYQKLKPHLPNGDELCLDIGARYGELSMNFAEKGHPSIAIEMNNACVQASREYGFNHIHKARISDIADVLEKYDRENVDMITMIDVIEHLTTPNDDFEKIASVQKKGQKLFITTMFLDSVGHRWFGEDWYYIHGQHTLYFTRKSISQFLDLHGYNVIAIDYIPLYKNAKKILEERKKNRLHKKELKVKEVHSNKKWFATNRPHCLDLMNIIAEKR